MGGGRHVAGGPPFAGEGLTFYEGLAGFQKDFYGKVRSSGSVRGIAGAAGELRSELKLGDLLRQFPELLALLASAGPAPGAEAARSMASRPPGEWTDLLTEFWTFGGRTDSEAETQDLPGEPLEEFVLRAFLQPYAEFLAGRLAEPPLAATYRVCPRCGSAPLLGVLLQARDRPKRLLPCCLCLQRWGLRPNC